MNATIQAFKYITSRELQKELLLNNCSMTGIFDLYNDKDVCQNVDCELFKQLQPIGIPNNVGMDYNHYSERFGKYIYDFFIFNINIIKAIL